MLVFIIIGIRGGISQISTRYHKANNKYIPEMLDETRADHFIFNCDKPVSYIVYQDMNNLYGN